MTQQCVNCPGAEDHSTAQCPLVSEQNKDAERAAFEAWRLEKFCAGVERLKKCSNAPDVYYYSAEQEAWKVWKARASLPVGVPDGYMPIPTAEQLADALENVRCFHDMSAELIAPELLANLLAVTAVKAEQVPTPEFVWVRLLEALHGDNGGAFTASTDDYREAKPALVQLIAAGFFRDDADSLDGDIWAVAAGEQGEAAARFASCPDAYAVLSDVLNRVFDRPDEAPSLPAAGSADLTAVRCQCCATEYPHDGYDAGFIAGSGMCQVCDAAIPAMDLPSAAPAEQPYPDGIAEDLERSDWAPLEALQWYAAGKHFDVADGRTRIIDTGAVASNALKHASLAYLELKGDAELSELRAALSAQQSAQQSASPEFCCELSYKAAKQKAWDARLIERCKCDHNEYCEHCWPDDFREGGKWHGGFETKQSVRASVPREWLDAVKELFDAKQAKEDFERENPGNSTKRWDACLYRIEAAEDALRALLNGGEA